VTSPRAESTPLSDRAEDERQRLVQVVKSTRDAVLSKDLEGVLTSWNPAAERLYGYSAEEAIGQRPEDLVHAVRIGDHKVTCQSQAHAHSDASDS